MKHATFKHFVGLSERGTALCSKAWDGHVSFDLRWFDLLEFVIAFEMCFLFISSRRHTPYYTHPDWKIYELNRRLQQRAEVCIPWKKMLYSFDKNIVFVLLGRRDAEQRDQFAVFMSCNSVKRYIDNL